MPWKPVFWFVGLVALLAILRWAWFTELPDVHQLGDRQKPAEQIEAASAELKNPQGTEGVRTVEAEAGDGAGEALDSTEPEVTLEADAPTSLQGRLVDDTGETLAGQTIELIPVGASFPVGSAPTHAQTDAEGRFEFVLNEDPGYLRVLASQRIQGKYVQFGGQARPLLHAGVNDLGDIVCEAGWSIRGTVLDEAGAAVADAKIECTDSVNRHFAKSDAAGRFALFGLAVGEHQVFAISERHAASEVQKVKVEPSNASHSIELEVQTIEPIQGRVVNEAGEPIENAKLLVSGPPVERQRRERTGATNALGEFEIYPASPGPNTIEIEHPEYQRKGPDLMGKPYRAGDKNLEFVLTKAYLQEFRVISKATREPIERYSIFIKGPPTAFGVRAHQVQVEDHPGGIAKRPAQPQRSEFTIRAPGYQSVTRSLSTAKGTVEIVALEPAWEVRGKVTRSGLGVQDVAIVMMPAEFLGTVPPHPSLGRADFTREHLETVIAKEIQAARRKASSNSAGKWRSLGFDGKTARTDANGEFVVQDLSERSYKLTAQLWGVASKSFEVRVGDSDLGTIELVDTGSIRGRVLVPEGLSFSKLRLNIGPHRAELEPDGTLHLPFVDPGSYPVTVRSIPGVLERMAIQDLELPVLDVASNQVTEATIDLRPAGADKLSKLKLKVTLGKHPGARLRISWGEVGSDSRTSLGVTDEHGVMEVIAPTQPFELWHVGGKFKELGPLDLQTPGVHEVEVTLRTGELVLVLPNDFDWPEAGSVSIHPLATDAWDEYAYGPTAVMTILEGVPQNPTEGGFEMGLHYLEDSRELRWIGIPFGTREFQVRITGKVGEPGATETTEPVNATRRLNIREGEAARWDLGKSQSE